MEPGLPTVQQGTGLVFLALVLLVTVGAASQAWSVYGGLVVTEIGLLLVPLLVLGRRWRLDLPRCLRLGTQGIMPLSRSLPAGAGIGLLAFVMAMGLTLPLVLLVILCGGEYPGLPLPLAGTGDFLTALAVGAVLAPVCEELLFRGFLLTSLRRFGPHVAVWVAGACFGIFHLDPVRFVPTMALGVVYGYLALASGSVLPGMVAHALNNGLALTLGYAAGAGESTGESISYAGIKAEIVQGMEGSGALLPGLSEDQMVLLSLVVTGLAMLMLGILMLVLVWLALRALGRRHESPAWTAAADVRELARVPWLWGIGSLGLLFWGLSWWTIFRA